jgi:hypothetical protein
MEANNRDHAEGNTDGQRRGIGVEVLGGACLQCYQWKSEECLQTASHRHWARADTSLAPGRKSCLTDVDGRRPRLGEAQCGLLTSPWFVGRG